MTLMVSESMSRLLQPFLEQENWPAFRASITAFPTLLMSSAVDIVPLMLYQCWTACQDIKYVLPSTTCSGNMMVCLAPTTQNPWQRNLLLGPTAGLLRLQRQRQSCIPCFRRAGRNTVYIIYFKFEPHTLLLSGVCRGLISIDTDSHLFGIGLREHLE